MAITLKPDQEQFVEAQIKAGRYTDAEAVIAQAFRLLEEYQDGYAEWLVQTREKLQVGIEQVKRGEVLDGETVIANLRAKIQQARDAQG
jgi:antitoxin ParD1/3/4